MVLLKYYHPMDRQLMKNTKEDLISIFRCKNVMNYGKLFIVSKTKKPISEFVESVYLSNLKKENTSYFSVLLLDPGVFVGDEPTARELQKNFRGTVIQTPNRHIAEWMWTSEDGPIKKKDAVKAIFCMV